MKVKYPTKAIYNPDTLNEYYEKIEKQEKQNNAIKIVMSLVVGLGTLTVMSILLF